jgi:hypothetical protein
MLGKLRRLQVGRNLSGNILDHMKFGVFQNLQELDAGFEGASLEGVQDMKRITPNLKKIVIQFACSETINAVLETLENFETIKLWNVTSWELTEKIHQNIKKLHLDCKFEFKFNAEQFSQQFPNLEYLRIDLCSSNQPFLATLFTQLKRLKILYMKVFCYYDFEPKSALQCFQDGGKTVEDAKIVFWFSDSRSVRFAAEKRLGGPVCIHKSKARFSLDASWMRKVF